MSGERFKAEPALATLKPFQRRTVDYVFERMYGKHDPVRRFLVADEVGLGKSMIARGVIAKMIEHLWDSTKRIDILYICSNQSIAAQNLKRLNVTDRNEVALPTRMTLLPLQMRGKKQLNNQKINFVSLTPGTTFELRSATGVIEERAFLYRLLESIVEDPDGLKVLLKVDAGDASWKSSVDGMSLERIDGHTIKSFQTSVDSDPVWLDALNDMCRGAESNQEPYPAEKRYRRNKLIGELRAKLSRACISALQPDLIIMDEFQKFRDLLGGESDGARLTQELIDYTDESGNSARTLLLSATPYKMMTLRGDAPEDGDHYQDFLNTVGFLCGDDSDSQHRESLSVKMKQFRASLCNLPDSKSTSQAIKDDIQNSLLRVMTRTERVSSTTERDSMMRQLILDAAIEPNDLNHAATATSIARALNAPEIVEYWKSSPYLINFMRNYKLGQKLNAAKNAPSNQLKEAIASADSAILKKETVKSFQPIDLANGRLRALASDIFERQAEKNLWIPASLPYYGDVESARGETKSLIFSRWSMVPDAISALISYEAERRMGMGASGNDYFQSKWPRPLQFRRDSGRLTGLRILQLIYPSPAIAEHLDPLKVFANSDALLTYEDMRMQLKREIPGALPSTDQIDTSPAVGASTEWSLGAMIDRLHGMDLGEWLRSTSGLLGLGSEDAFADHVLELADAAQGNKIGGFYDVENLVVDVALGSPAVCALRALKRVAPDLKWDDHVLLSSASRVAWSFRTLFNQPDAVAMLRKDSDEVYWRSVLAYCAQNNLQSTLDEYVHYLLDAEGLMTKPSSERVSVIAEAIVKAMSVRPSSIEVDTVSVEEDGLKITPFSMRGRFAMRLGDYKDEDGAVARLGNVRDAFNSPFRPFVLATTSIGQEGLDFHPYCYRLYHWNLPENPVDLEQREGRVHRFKNHAIRLNLAEKQAAALKSQWKVADDPWNIMFDVAHAETADKSGLIPYWIYEGSIKVERRIPIYPFSKEVDRLQWLKRSLTLYRLTFGQPRQDELLDYLNSIDQKTLGDLNFDDFQIQLRPAPNTDEEPT